MEKQRRIKMLSLSAVIVAVLGLTVAFAALSATLNINGTAYLDAAKWGIRFENLSSPTKIGSATTTGTAKIEETKSAEITGINVSLSTPGDKVTYTVDLVNKGTINAKIDNIEKTVLTSEQQKYLTFKVTDKEGKEVSEGDILSKGETRNLTITIEFIKDLTKEDLPKQTSTISLSYKLNFVQTDDKATSENQEPSAQACTSFDKKDTYNVGDVIALCNTNTGKSEDFYVIKDNGSTITALAKYNLLIGDSVELDLNNGGIANSTSIPTSEEGYGLQNSDAGYMELDSEGRPKSNILKGTKTFSEDGYWKDSNGKPLSKYGTNYPVYVFDSNSLLYESVQNYKTYLKNTLGKSSATVRLISAEELFDLGCKPTETAEYTCKSAPSWVYSTYYWTGSAWDSYTIWDVYGNEGILFRDTYADVPSMFGLRPVITISKSEL